MINADQCNLLNRLEEYFEEKTAPKTKKDQEKLIKALDIISKIKICDCADQICSGKFLQIYHWQNYCQWESLKRGLATHMDLKHNIFKNMKLILTIQELKDEKTKETYKGMFGTLTLQRHKDLFEEEMLDYAEKHKIYLAEVEKNEENGLIEPVKPVLKSINFAINTKSIEGLDDILNNLVTDATNLERQEQFKKMRAKTAKKNLDKVKEEGWEEFKNGKGE